MAQKIYKILNLPAAKADLLNQSKRSNLINKNKYPISTIRCSCIGHSGSFK